MPAERHARERDVRRDGVGREDFAGGRRIAVKDTGLIAAAMRESGTDTMLIEAVACQYRKTAAGGHGGEDMAAVYRAFRP